MTRELIFVIEEAREGGFVAQALGHSIYTKANAWEDLNTAIWDAIACHFDEDHRPFSYPTCFIMLP